MQRIGVLQNLGVVALCAWLLVSAAGADPGKLMESFEEGIPGGLTADGAISVDRQRMKFGQQSLRWDWINNGKLVLDTPIGYRKQRLLSLGNSSLLEHVDARQTNVYEPPRGIFMWVYNQNPRPQRLRIEFGRGEEVDCWFDFNINFKGWRTIALNYDWGTMRGVPREDMTRMTINAPTTGTGTLYFDMIGTSVPMNPRTVGPNPQLPEIPQHPRLVAQYPHLLLAFSQYTPSFLLRPVTAEVVADFRKMEEAAKAYWDGLPDAAESVNMDAIRERFARFQIRREGDEIFGAPLHNSNIVLEYFAERGVPRAEARKEFISWRWDFNSALIQIARAWVSSGDETQKTELAQMFIDLFDYGVDQGFDEGAGLGWIHHYSYVIRDYAPAMLIMRDVLKEAGRLEKAVAVCKWMYGFGQVYREDLVYGWPGRKSSNADEIQGIVPQRLVTALLMEDSPEKARDIEHFASYFSNVTAAYADALDETFKPDGTIFHHAGHTYGYGGRAAFGAVLTYDILNRTRFQVSEAARQRLVKVAKTYYAGLFPVDERRKAPKAFATCRFTGYTLPHRYAGMLQLLGSSEIDVSGVRMLSYSSIGMKRQGDDWLITTRAHSKYVHPFESWGKNFFAYPLFVANGYTDISYPHSVDSLTPNEGSEHFAGFDWRRWPGATAVKLPFKQIETRVGQSRDEGGEYLFSDQAFVGGVETTHGVGAKVFRFRGHSKYGLESFTGHKSWFFYGNKVLCLGTNLRSQIPGYPVETTVFQLPIDAWEKPIHVDGKVIDGLNQSWSAGDQTSWMLDSRGTGYVFPRGGVRLKTAEQTSPDYQGRKDVTGRFATAWFDHGISPEDASYEYLMVAGASPEEMAAVSETPGYQVLEASESAHVVALWEEKSIAYAVYAEQGVQFDEGAVRAANKQSTFVVRRDGDKLRLSVADPDLNIYDGQDDLLPDGSRNELAIYEREWFFWSSRPNAVRITLKGHWKIDELVVPMETADRQPRVVSKEGGVTVIEIICRDGLSAEVLLSAE